MGTNEFETAIPWSNWNPIWSILYDMECDGTVDYVKKMFKKSKIDQVLDFYGIPYIYKHEYKKYLKYRIEPRHYQVVTDYFSVILRSEWYDTTDFDFGKLQEEYNIKVPVAEATGLELHVNYADFLERDKQHREALSKWENIEKDEQIWQMQWMMQQMMVQMAELQKQIWNPNVLLSKENNDDWQQPSWSDSARNAEWTTDTTNNQKLTPQDNGEAWMTTEDSSWWIDSSTSEAIKWDIQRAEWPELIWSDSVDWSNNWTKPFAIRTNNETIGEISNWTVEAKKDRRTA